MRPTRTGISIVVSLLVAGGTLPAQGPPSSRTQVADASISARRNAPILGVFDADAGTPIEGVEIVDLFLNNVYRTEANGLVGLWVFQSRNDSAAVRIRKIGYADTAFVVMVGARDTTPVSIFLRKAVTLPGMIAEAIANKHLTPNMQEFEGRLNDMSLTGRFLTAADLDKHSSKPISDVIYDLTAGKSRGCSVPLTLYVDGIRGGVHPDTDGTTATDYQGIEFYTPGAAPLRFNATADATNSSTGTMQSGKSQTGGAQLAVGATIPTTIRAAASCGVVLLWKRERL